MRSYIPVAAVLIMGKLSGDYVVTQVAKDAVARKPAIIAKLTAKTPAFDEMAKFDCPTHGKGLLTGLPEGECRDCHTDKIRLETRSLLNAKNWLRRPWWLQFMSGWPYIH